MPDISTVWDNVNAVGDWVMVGPDLESGDDLVTATLISLFSDQTADPADVIPDRSNDPRGWWGDAGEAYPIGSRLWTLDPGKALPGVPAQARDMAKAATQWMLDDGVCSRIDVDALYFRPGGLGLALDLFPPSGPPLSLKFAKLWAEVS